MEAVIPVIGVLAGLISLTAFPPYIFDMFKGTTRPERASWFIWTVLSIIAFTTQIAEGARWSLILIGVQTFGITLTFLLSLKFGYGGLKKRDIVSLIVASFGLVLWGITNQPILALVLVIIIDIAGAWLTVYKAYRDPESETEITWWLDSVASSLGVIAVGAITPSLLLYPGYLVLANFSVVVGIRLGRMRKRSSVKIAKNQ